MAHLKNLTFLSFLDEPFFKTILKLDSINLDFFNSSNNSIINFFI